MVPFGASPPECVSDWAILSLEEPNIVLGELFKRHREEFRVRCTSTALSIEIEQNRY
jgi:hypothetical protein